ncbi:Predicted membrane protein [Prochlorococcus marinus str. MIT 9515]|uniref:Predicted membrane protein n=1 Tax=Prochlorococcus marinus (strain MIT 9515) TaxID=167542 RepID=A2BY92_PROM5|nr:DUF805 domain-containing protein [Prochlorococcus marinus]ABM72753.1 Predicted membrane protein [Prochlorococcus marinus str. MIT 9515]
MYSKIFNAYQEFWLKATDFESKTTRLDWWYVQLANVAISIIAIPIFLRTFGFNVYGLICILPQIAIDIRRLKDFGKNWKWIFINLLPVFGWLIWFIWLGFGKSGNGRSKFI